MAMPMDPELFPDTYVEPFIVAPEVAELAESVLADFDDFVVIRLAIRDGVRIAYVFETKPFDPAKDDYKPHIIAKVTKASPLWRLLGEHELAIQFRQPFWDAFDEQQRRAVLHHEFQHVELTKGDNGRWKVGLKEHDVEDFTRTMRAFGPILPSRAGFIKAFLDWKGEQREAKEQASKVAEQVGDALVDHADDMQPLADELGYEVAVSANGRTRRLVPKKRAAETPVDEADVRPAGEVNVDELRGAVERSSEPTPFRPRRPAGDQPHAH